MMYSSREPFNDDPKPYVTYADERRTDVRSKEWDVQSEGAVEYVRVLDPRPEYNRPQNNPTNPILAEFREKLAGADPYWSDIYDSTMDWLDHAEAWDYYCSSRGLTADHIDHARRVLTRLANFQKGGIMKRYKVVQDANGQWGIWDTRLLDADFASWGWDCADLWEDIVICAERLNAGTAERDEFEWTFYEPRKGDR